MPKKLDPINAREFDRAAAACVDLAKRRWYANGTAARELERIGNVAPLNPFIVETSVAHKCWQRGYDGAPL